MKLWQIGTICVCVGACDPDGFFKIGARATTNSPLYFGGSIDDVQLRYRILTSNEIYALYQLGSTNFGGTH
jgi:hypothetical protein